MCASRHLVTDNMFSLRITVHCTSVRSGQVVGLSGFPRLPVAIHPPASWAGNMLFLRAMLLATHCSVDVSESQSWPCRVLCRFCCAVGQGQARQANSFFSPIRTNGIGSSSRYTGGKKKYFTAIAKLCSRIIYAMRNAAGENYYLLEPILSQYLHTFPPLVSTYIQRACSRIRHVQSCCYPTGCHEEHSPRNCPFVDLYDEANESSPDCGYPPRPHPDW